LDYSRKALSDVSGGAANFFGQHHTVAMLHDIQRQLSEQAHQLSEQAQKMDCQAHKMDCQHQEIAELRRALERAETILAKIEEEKDIWLRRSEAYRKQVSRRNLKDGSELGVQHAQYRHLPPGCEEKVVISTEMIANEKEAHRMAMVRADGLQKAPAEQQQLDAPPCSNTEMTNKRSRSGCQFGYSSHVAGGPDG
jgi:hypothetical protein